MVGQALRDAGAASGRRAAAVAAHHIVAPAASGGPSLALVIDDVDAAVVLADVLRVPAIERLARRQARPRAAVARASVAYCGSRSLSVK